MSGLSSRLAKLEQANQPGRMQYFLSGKPQASREEVAAALEAEGYTLGPDDLYMSGMGEDGEEDQPMRVLSAAPFKPFEDWLEELEKAEAAEKQRQ